MSVFLSISRHEEYDPHSITKNLTPFGIANAWFTAKMLKKNKNLQFDTIYHSPKNRCKATAVIYGFATDSFDIRENPRLDENAKYHDLEDFKQEVIVSALEDGINHVHVVSHYDQICTFCNLMRPLDFGETLLFKAESWENIADKRSLGKSIDHYHKFWNFKDVKTIAGHISNERAKELYPMSYDKYVEFSKIEALITENYNLEKVLKKLKSHEEKHLDKSLLTAGNRNI